MAPLTPLQLFLSSKKENTQATYGYWLPKLFKLMRLTDQKVLELAQSQGTVAVWNLAKESSKGRMKHSGRRLALNGLRTFLRANNFYPPADRIQNSDSASDTEEGEGFLTHELVTRITKAAPIPYNYIFELMYTSFWGAREFLLFNSEATWSKIQAWHTQKPQALYYRFDQKGGRKTNEKPFHTLVDGRLIRRILQNLKVPVTTEREAPLNLAKYKDYRNARHYLATEFQDALKAAEIKTEETEGHVSLHELRDTRKTEATTHGVAREVAEFAMGHKVVDPLKYEKCWRDTEWVWTELQKLPNCGDTHNATPLE